MANTNIRTPNEVLDDALSTIPARYRKRLISHYLDAKVRSLEGKHDAAGVSVGKFCEVVLRLLEHELTGSGTPFNRKINNFENQCRALEQTPQSAGHETLRLVIPRALSFLYTLRNKRGIGHVGGDVDANSIDTAAMTRVTDWVACELIRVFHSLSLEEAQDLVDNLAVRNIPDVWTVGGKKRVLTEGLTKKDQVLLILYSDVEAAVLTEDLIEWVEYSNATVFKKSVLLPLHKDRLIEYDSSSELVYISPKGVAAVEEMLQSAI